MTRIEVRALAASEVGRLEREEPPGRGFARAMWAAQEAGGSTLLVAWDGDRPVGAGLDDPRARALYERLGYRGTGEITTTSYAYVDDTGVSRQAIETDERLVRDLGRTRSTPV